jgi:phosphoadenosine phosphosulfate reductase
VRRDQSAARAGTEEIAWDERRGLWKANPLASWSDADVWAYIAEHDLPYNRLHDQGYASIGCTHCTLPSNGREGRWAGTEKTECGLHA